MSRLSHAARFGIILSSALLAACGGGGGDASSGPANPGTGNNNAAPQSTILSGTAASGAPITGTISVKDSSATPIVRQVTINADGSYSIDVSGMTAPFIIKADGIVSGTDHVTVTSVATQNDIGKTVNVTPMSDLIVGSVAKQDGSAFFDGYTNTDANALNANAINTAGQSVTAALRPVLAQLGLPADTDLIHAGFATNHSNMDGLLDVVHVDKSAGPSDVKLTNIVDGSVPLNVDLTSGQVTGQVSANTNPGQVLSDLQQIQRQLDGLSAQFANGSPSSINPLLPYFVQNGSFMSDGYGLNDYLTNFIAKANLKGFVYKDVSIDKVNADGSLWIKLAGQWADGEVWPHRWLMKKDPVSGKWLVAGDGRVTSINVIAKNEVTTNGTVWAYLGFEVSSQNAPATIHHIVVTGPGLPTAGIMLLPQDASLGLDWFKLSFYQGSGGNELTQAQCTTYYGAGCHINDATIPVNAKYVFSFYDSSNTLIYGGDDVYTVNLPAPPLSKAQALAAVSTAFPTIQSTSIASGNINVTWVIPSGKYNESFYGNVNDPSTGSYLGHVDFNNLIWNQTSAALALPANAPANSAVMGAVGVRDLFKRGFYTDYAIN